MEDRISCHLNLLSGFSEDQTAALRMGSLTYLSVFDGHNGELVVQSLSEQLHERIVTHLTDKLVSSPTSTPTVSVGAILEDTCQELDFELLKRDYHRQLESVQKGTAMYEHFSGCVGVVVTLYEAPSDPSRVKMTIANVGDCRAVISNVNGVSLSLAFMCWC